MDNTRLRCFIAVSLPEDVQRTLGMVQKKIESLVGKRARLPRKENLHITLSFLGNLRSDHLEAVVTAMDSACSGERPFFLGCDRLGVFPQNRHKARVVWSGIGGEVYLLEKLHRKLMQELAALGYSPERFSPHITLARFKFPPPARVINEILINSPQLPAEGNRFTVRELHLFKSELSRDGAWHTRLHASLLKR